MALKFDYFIRLNVGLSLRTLKKASWTIINLQCGLYILSIHSWAIGPVFKGMAQSWMNSDKVVKVQNDKKVNSTIHFSAFSLFSLIPHRMPLGIPSQILPINTCSSSKKKVLKFYSRLFSLVSFN